MLATPLVLRISRTPTSRMATAVLALGALLAAVIWSGNARAQARSLQQPGQPGAAAPSVPLRVVERQQFCSRLAQTFANYGAASGYSKVEMALLAAGGSVGVTQEFRAGRVSDFINAAALATYARVPVRATDSGFLPLTSFVGEAMGINGQVTMALSPAELRFIPYAQRGIDLVVIAQDTAALTPERMQKVAALARGMSIKIHVVWVGETDADGKDLRAATPLAWIAAMTGGSFANLGGAVNPCAQAT